jgi:hypothetical protein
MARRFAGLMLGALLGLTPGALYAGPLSFTQNFVADFELSFLAGTLLNQGTEDTPFIPFRATGALTFVLDPSLNDPSRPTTVAITNVTGTLTGESPGFLLPYSLTPDLEFLHGSLTNIIRDGAGDVTSADVTDLQMRWRIDGPGGITLFTMDGLPFNGAITSLPFAYGNVLSGAADFNGYMVTPAGSSLVAVGRNRTLTAVPEPASLVLAGLGTNGVLGVVRRRRS